MPKINKNKIMSSPNVKEIFHSPFLPNPIGISKEIFPINLDSSQEDDILNIDEDIEQPRHEDISMDIFKEMRIREWLEANALHMNLSDDDLNKTLEPEKTFFDDVNLFSDDVECYSSPPKKTTKMSYDLRRLSTDKPECNFKLDMKAPQSVEGFNRNHLKNSKLLVNKEVIKNKKTKMIKIKNNLNKKSQLVEKMKPQDIPSDHYLNNSSKLINRIFERDKLDSKVGLKTYGHLLGTKKLQNRSCVSTKREDKIKFSGKGAADKIAVDNLLKNSKDDEEDILKNVTLLEIPDKLNKENIVAFNFLAKRNKEINLNFNDSSNTNRSFNEIFCNEINNNVSIDAIKNNSVILQKVDIFNDVNNISLEYKIADEKSMVIDATCNKVTGTTCNKVTGTTCNKVTDAIYSKVTDAAVKIDNIKRTDIKLNDEITGGQLGPIYNMRSKSSNLVPRYIRTSSIIQLSPVQRKFMDNDSEFSAIEPGDFGSNHFNETTELIISQQIREDNFWDGSLDGDADFVYSPFINLRNIPADILDVSM